MSSSTSSSTLFLLAFALCCSLGVSAQTETTQQDSAWWKHWKVTGSVQSDVLVPQEDYKLGTGTYDSPVLTNTYAEAHLNSAHIGIGARFEFLQYPLPGYEPEFKGWGLGMLYLKGKWNTGEVTVGSFYDQFGSGFIFRTYENRSLGIDNSLMGLRVLYKPYKGITLKVLGGHQRRYWEYNKGLVAGADLELNIDQWVQKMQEKGTYWTIGLSAVNKYEPVNADEIPARTVYTQNERGDEVLNIYSLNVPKNVQAYDVRTQLQVGDFNILAEYAGKTYDPSIDNNYTYRYGNAALLSASWSKKGISGLFQVKRSEDMSFRSKRSVTGTSSQINHLPAFAMQHTYALAAIYPYATQMADGEWAFQTEWAYSIKKHTFLGGKYGTHVQLHFSHIRSLDKQPLDVDDVTGTSGYTNGFGIGKEIYYQDANLQISHKFSKVFKLNFMYMNQIYNKTVVEGKGGKIYSNIFVADGRFTLSKKVTLRAEAQYLQTCQDQGDWFYALLELSLQPHWMITLADMYNANVPDQTDIEKTNKVHYWQALLTWTYGAHRLQAGYVKTRAGYNCAGGVCRYVPASKGVQINYSFSF